MNSFYQALGIRTSNPRVAQRIDPLGHLVGKLSDGLGLNYRIFDILVFFLLSPSISYNAQSSIFITTTKDLFFKKFAESGIIHMDYAKKFHYIFNFPLFH
jgi:hypothetical protein